MPFLLLHVFLRDVQAYKNEIQPPYKKEEWEQLMILSSQHVRFYFFQSSIASSQKGTLEPDILDQDEAAADNDVVDCRNGNL